MQGIESDLRRSLAGLRVEQQHAHDWEPWLVYADWLSSRNDPRGALIVCDDLSNTIWRVVPEVPVVPAAPGETGDAGDVPSSTSDAPLEAAGNSGAGN